MAAVGALTGAVAVISSFLPWIVAYPGGDDPHVSVSGLADGALGVWTVLVGMALVLGGLFAGMLENPGRAALSIVPALLGIVVCAIALARSVGTGGGNLANGSPSIGLFLEVMAFGTASLGSVILAVLDHRSLQDASRHDDRPTW